MVVHIHDRLPTGRIASLVLRLIARHATAVVGCSRYVTDPLPEVEPGRVVRVVYNLVDPQRFYPQRTNGSRFVNAWGSTPQTSFSPWSRR